MCVYARIVARDESQMMNHQESTPYSVALLIHEIQNYLRTILVRFDSCTWKEVKSYEFTEVSYPEKIVLIIIEFLTKI